MPLHQSPTQETLPGFMSAVETARSTMTREEWRDFCASTPAKRWREFLAKDPYTRRALETPRGYAGDAVVMDYAYGHASILDTLTASCDVGKAVYQATHGSRMSASARLRLDVIAREIRTLAEQRDGISVASFASGHARELDMLRDIADLITRFHAVDGDAVSVAEVEATHGNTFRILPVQRNVFRMRKDAFEPVDMAYSMGLFDYLEDKPAERIVDLMAGLVAPRGRLVIGNLLPEAGNLAYCEFAMDWWMIPRSMEAMERLGQSLAHRGGWTWDVQGHGCFAYLIADREG